MKRYWKYVVWALVLAIVGLLAYAYARSAATPGPLDGFAQCLGERDAVFYGAFWCPHCKSQKEMFGRSAKHLPYVECSYPNGRGQVARCVAEGIKGYPTWVFADGARLEGEVSLDELAAKTGCVIPQPEST